MVEININNDFSDCPGGRYREEGPHSGQEFRENVLDPKYKEARDKHVKLSINFDDCFGFSSSFLEEAFGGFVRKLKVKNIYNDFIIISNDDETIPNKIKKYMTEAENRL